MKLGMLTSEYILKRCAELTLKNTVIILEQSMLSQLSKDSMLDTIEFQKGVRLFRAAATHKFVLPREIIINENISCHSFLVSQDFDYSSVREVTLRDQNEELITHILKETVNLEKLHLICRISFEMACRIMDKLPASKLL